jgi:ribosomal protein S18 acetylase RimI-like enzyme
MSPLSDASRAIVNQRFFFRVKGLFKPFVFLTKVMAKVEGSKESWHGHVTCLSVAPEFRRQGASKELMNVFEKTSEL